MQRMAKHGKANKGTFSRLFKMVFKLYNKKLILVLFLMIIATLFNIGAMSSVQFILEHALNNDKSGVIKIISIMMVLYAGSIIFTITHLRIMVGVGQGSLLYIRNNLFTHMMELPVSYFDRNKHGDVMSRYTNDVEATRQMISQSLPQLVVSLVSVLGYFTAMALTSWMLSIFTLIFSSILILITRIIAKNSRQYFAANQKNIGSLNGYIEEMIEGQKVVKVFRYEDRAKEEFSVLNEKVRETSNISTRRSGMLIPITVNVGYLGFAFAALLGAYLFTKGLITIPQLVAYLLLTRQFTGPINQMGQQLNMVQQALAGASRVFEVFDIEAEEDLGSVTLVNYELVNGEMKISNKDTNLWAWNTSEGLVKLEGNIVFDDVTFGYVENKTVLKNISLYAKTGQKIAFVGATGAGKTTITNLINRFYDINSGTITYDGIDLTYIKKSSLRRSLGMVLQDTHLFHNSVKENIRYGKLDATDEEVIEAAKLANAHEFILKLPQGYDTLLTDDGSNLSQGQRQLLSIARVAISNPPVLILDEATSSIDTYTEKLITEGMDKLMEGRTVFVIAHRLSTIKNSKAIIILDQGEIVERGNHDQLIENEGIYYQLFTGEFELE